MTIFIVSGKARSGKDTFSAALKSILGESYHLVAYAEELKLKCSYDFDLTHNQVHGDLKEVQDIRYPKQDGSNECWTPREILQFVGTDCYRKIDNDFWVKTLIKRINRDKLNDVIITDARFPNEVNIKKDLGAYHIRVVRDVTEKVHGKEHASETSLDGYEDVDFIVNNNKDIPNLFLEAKSIIKEINDGK